VSSASSEAWSAAGLDRVGKRGAGRAPGPLSSHFPHTQVTGLSGRTARVWFASTHCDRAPAAWGVFHRARKSRTLRRSCCATVRTAPPTARPSSARRPCAPLSVSSGRRRAWGALRALRRPPYAFATAHRVSCPHGLHPVLALIPRDPACACVLSLSLSLSHSHSVRRPESVKGREQSAQVLIAVASLLWNLCTGRLRTEGGLT